MALTNARAAWVNRSSTTIPVFHGTVSSQVHTGGITAGGAQTGSIASNDFYTLIPNDNLNITCYEVCFRNSQGQLARGFIETSPGATLGNFAWVAQQQQYHLFNSNGSALVTSATESVGGMNCRIFTIHGSARQFLNSEGRAMGTLPVGARLATTSSTVGANNPHFMYFRFRTLNGVWVDMVSSGNPWGFVDMGIGLGVSPSNRRLR